MVGAGVMGLNEPAGLQFNDDTVKCPLKIILGKRLAREILGHWAKLRSILHEIDHPLAKPLL